MCWEKSFVYIKSRPTCFWVVMHNPWNSALVFADRPVINPVSEYFGKFLSSSHQTDRCQIFSPIKKRICVISVRGWHSKFTVGTRPRDLTTRIKMYDLFGNEVPWLKCVALNSENCLLTADFVGAGCNSTRSTRPRSRARAGCWRRLGMLVS